MVNAKLSILLFVSALVMSVLLCYNSPFDEDSLLPSCFFYKCTSLYCPGCGATRAVYAFAHGDLLGALRLNALIFILLPALLLLAFYPKVATWKNLPLFILIITVTFFILRNIPCFYFLSPS